MANFVTAPLVIVKNQDGSDLYVYKGAPLPSHVKGDALKQLVDAGLVGSQEDLTAQPEGDAPAVEKTAKK